MTHSRLSIMFDDALMNRVLDRCAKETLAVSSVIHEAVENYLSGHASVLNDWVHELSLMQQSVLLAMVRNADGIAKDHPQKELIKWFRRCVLKSAFDRKQLHSPGTPGGGSFTGPVADIEAALDEFIWARDEMTLHYFSHAMHAFEIMGYHYPDDYVREFWFRAYHRMVDALHLMPESKYEMDKRLSDDPAAWRAREDKCGGCTSTEPPRREVVAAIADKITEACVPADTPNAGEIKSLSDLIPSDGQIYAAVSQRMGDKTTIVDGKPVQLGEYVKEDATAKTIHNSASQANVADENEPVPAWAAVHDGAFVNAYSGLSLGHEFDLKWGTRIAEFRQYVDIPSEAGPKRPHDERGWQPK